jgi:hypothetical protein
MLRLGDAFNDPIIVGHLVLMALHQVTLDALNEGLGCRNLSDNDFQRIQEWLATINEVTRVETMFRCELLQTEPAFETFRKQVQESREDTSWIDRIAGNENFGSVMFSFAMRHGPSGWYDTNRACYIENALLHCGGTGDEGWRAGVKGAETVAKGAAATATLYSNGKFMLPNPRRALAMCGIPALSNIWHKAAQNLFKRRCAILTCALRRYRLAHGAFPASLADLDGPLLPSPQTDPAKAGSPMGYKLTEKGFLLWSVGDDRNDDGGETGKDWLWSHEVM